MTFEPDFSGSVEFRHIKKKGNAILGEGNRQSITKKSGDRATRSKENNNILYH